MLRPLDLLLALKVQSIMDGRSTAQSGSKLAEDGPALRAINGWTFASLGESIGISASQAHSAMKRAVASGIMGSNGAVKPMALFRALLAAKYYVPGSHGAPVRGMPTSYAAPPLSELMVQGDDLPPVWPASDGEVRGLALEPIYKTAPKSAKQDSRLYSYLALLDAVRSGRSREAGLAEEELGRRLGVRP